MPTERIFLIGAGGHSLVVLDALAMTADTAEVCIFDQSANRIGKKCLNLTVQRFDSSINVPGHGFHVCIGDNNVRARMFDMLRAAGGLPRTVVHPGATIARSARIGSGSFIAAGAIIAPAVTLGDGVIINHGATVDHECMVGSHSHLAPGATLAGNVRVGAKVLVGAGANILPGISIGAAAIVGAGAVVNDNIPAGSTYVGVPARRIR